MLPGTIHVPPEQAPQVGMGSLGPQQQLRLTDQSGPPPIVPPAPPQGTPGPGFNMFPGQSSTANAVLPRQAAQQPLALPPPVKQLTYQPRLKNAEANPPGVIEGGPMDVSKQAISELWERGLNSPPKSASQAQLIDMVRKLMGRGFP